MINKFLKDFEKCQSNADILDLIKNCNRYDFSELLKIVSGEFTNFSLTKTLHSYFKSKNDEELSFDLILLLKNLDSHSKHTCMTILNEKWDATIQNSRNTNKRIKLLETTRLLNFGVSDHRIQNMIVNNKLKSEQKLKILKEYCLFDSTENSNFWITLYTSAKNKAKISTYCAQATYRTQPLFSLDILNENFTEENPQIKKIGINATQIGLKKHNPTFVIKKFRNFKSEFYSFLIENLRPVSAHNVEISSFLKNIENDYLQDPSNDKLHKPYLSYLYFIHRTNTGTSKIKRPSFEHRKKFKQGVQTLSSKEKGFDLNKQSDDQQKGKSSAKYSSDDIKSSGSVSRVQHGYKLKK